MFYVVYVAIYMLSCSDAIRGNETCRLVLSHFRHSGIASGNGF